VNARDIFNRCFVRAAGFFHVFHFSVLVVAKYRQHSNSLVQSITLWNHVLLHVRVQAHCRVLFLLLSSSLPVQLGFVLLCHVVGCSIEQRAVGVFHFPVVLHVFVDLCWILDFCERCTAVLELGAMALICAM
jgi:hypothetical protein